MKSAKLKTYFPAFPNVSTLLNQTHKRVEMCKARSPYLENMERKLRHNNKVI